MKKLAGYHLPESLFYLHRSFELMDSTFGLSVTFRIQKVEKRLTSRKNTENYHNTSIEPASRSILGDEADQNVLSFAQNSKIELQI